MRALPALLVVICCLAGANAGVWTTAAAQDTGTTLTINQLDASMYPQLTAVVTVLDDDGLPVPGLVPSQFQAYDSGTQLELTQAVAAQDQDLRLDVVITVDVSGSMEGEPLASAKAAAIDFVQSLGPNDRAALVSFSDEVTPVVSLTDDKEELVGAITNLQALGGTALFEAVEVSTFLAAAAAADGTRASVVLLSDGENDTGASNATAESSSAVAAGSGIPVYPIAFGALTDKAYLQQIAELTDGIYRDATPGTVASVYEEISSLLRSQYVLTAVAVDPANGEDGELQILAFIGTEQASASAAFQRGSVAPPPPEDGEPDAVPPTPGEEGSSNSGRYAAYGLGLLLLLGLAGGAFIAYTRWQGHRRELARQLAVVAPNPQLAAKQGVPRAVGSYRAAEHAQDAAIAEQHGTGRLIEKGGEERVIEIGSGPVVIGSSPRVCNVLVHNGGSIAPEHARIWLRGKGYVLHHVGGLSRKTFVSGHEADWVGLDDGDEIVIGKWRFVFRDNDDPLDPLRA